jgi:hypothetical protein
MRVAIFIAVVAVHIVLLWLLPSWRRAVLLPVEGETSMTSVFLPLLPQRAQPEVPRQTTPAAHKKPSRGENSGWWEDTRAREGSEGTADPGTLAPAPSTLTLTPPDWRAEAGATAQNNAQHIVEDEDEAAREAAALTSHFKPLPGPRVAGPEFGWDYTHTHRVTPLEGGGFVVALNDRCNMLVFIVPMMIGCAVGRGPPARGDLFTNMHRPMKFGDWDWRVDNP